MACGMIAWLWGLGFAATPQEYKRQAWDHLKWIWTWMAINEVQRGIGHGGRGRRW